MSEMAEVDERVSPRTRITKASTRLIVDGIELHDGSRVYPSIAVLAAIEAEAVALDRAELVAAVREMGGANEDARDWHEVYKPAVLALIEGEKGTDHAD